MFTRTFPALCALAATLATAAPVLAETLTTLPQVMKVCDDQGSTVESARRGTENGRPVIFVTCKGVSALGPIDGATGLALGSMALLVFAITSTDGTSGTTN
jgi:hypothetical protein